jgi:hypothetical protein
VIDAITAAVTELARFALLAYVARQARDVIVHWIDHGRPVLRTSLEEQILDAARENGIDLAQLAGRTAE